VTTFSIQLLLHTLPRIHTTFSRSCDRFRVDLDVADDSRTETSLRGNRSLPSRSRVVRAEKRALFYPS
jgi:hypothetical protein